MKKITKFELTEKLYEKGIAQTKKESVDLVEAVFKLMKETLSKKESLKIAKFGIFNVREKNRRTGRNPQTGEKLEISGRTVVTFQTSPTLKDSMNKTKP